MTRRSRNQIGPLIHDIKEACRRPLFTEICLDETRQTNGCFNRASSSSSKAPTAVSSSSTSESLLSQSLVLSSSDIMKQAQVQGNVSKKRTWKEVSVWLCVWLCELVSWCWPLDDPFRFQLFCYVAHERSFYLTFLHDRGRTWWSFSYSSHSSAWIPIAIFHWQWMVFIAAYTRRPLFATNPDLQ